ncbi:hypothetical protein [Robertkochia solimangrovi]|uniref:hypothetical protein n=1 Tax=Robertkochia solimangrovi TaxID=2213046 RepID=UPI0011807BF2|nr:hypothetical protein [Robertkochia solimangrovi]TRZ42207.1 hypothetical protein DMZ48_14350 [Robertkochia solimangrovi]
MSNQPIKAGSKEFTKEPFHLIQSNGMDKRYVVSLRDKVRVRTLLTGFINQSKNDIQIKIRDLDNPKNPIDYSGSLGNAKLHELMTKHEDVIFHNGYHDLMIRNPDSGDYVAFDEHGLIFIYTNQDYSEILKNLEAEYKPDEKLIYEFNHWHYCLPKGREKLADMIKDFELKKE